MAHNNKNHTPQALQLLTLSGVYEAGREVTRVTTIDTCSTYDRLAMRLKYLASTKGREELIQLHKALDRLSSASHTLGTTTLINPADHPLVVRRDVVMPKDKR